MFLEVARWHLEPLAALVVVSVVKGLDVEQDGESIVLPGLRSL